MCSVLSIRPYLDTIQMTSIFICHFPYTINQTPKADKSVPNSAFKNLFLISEILKLKSLYVSPCQQDQLQLLVGRKM